MFTEKNLFFLHCSFHLNCHLPLLLLCFSLLIFLKYLLVIGCAFPLKHEGNWKPHFWVFIYFIFVLLYNIVLVLPYINMNPPRVYMCSQYWNSLPPPSPFHPSGSSQCTSPKHLVSCIEPGLVICFLYDIIHVLMPFSQIITPLPLPQSPEDCFIHLCLFCCLTYRVIVTIFLNSIYMR